MKVACFKHVQIKTARPYKQLLSLITWKRQSFCHWWWCTKDGDQFCMTDCIQQCHPSYFIINFLPCLLQTYCCIQHISFSSPPVHVDLPPLLYPCNLSRSLVHVILYIYGYAHPHISHTTSLHSKTSSLLPIKAYLDIIFSPFHIHYISSIFFF